ncbi:MAG: hypothetical protein HY253_10335 [Burkholderiales bacterium]|nr:hypothetical protein [Burkholderiales bacterium]
MKTIFIKIPVMIFLFLGLCTIFSDDPSRLSVSAEKFYSFAALAFFIIFLLPGIFRSIKNSSDAKRWANERHAQAEADHQNELRRERERIQMRNEESIQHLMATLQIQFRIDQQKMQQLEQIKRDFEKRKNADTASILARLEAMRASQ